MGAACRKGTNRVAVTEDVFRFISTHWRPAPTAKPGSGGKPGQGDAGAGTAKEAVDCDDVEMPRAAPTRADAADASAPQGQENTARNGAAGDRMDVDGEGAGAGAKDVAEGARREASGKEDSVHMHEHDDDDVIAMPSGGAATQGSAGQVRRTAAVPCSLLPQPI